jgi:probable rRNA maturation factor
MPVYVATRGLPSTPIKPERVRLAGERMLEALGRSRAELSVVLCDDDTIHELNRDYRRKDRPTDVLSFAMHEGEGGDLHPDLLGDVVISVDTARKQAAERGWAIASEVRFLLAHGLLHLLGYDHRTRDEERRMMAMGDALVAAAIRREHAASDRKGPSGRRRG